MSATISNGVTPITPLALIGYESTQATGNVLHDILGRADDDVSFGQAGLRSGTLTFLFGSGANAYALRDLYAAPGKLTLVDTDSTALNMTHVCSGNIVVAIVPDSHPQYWTLAVDFQEVV